MRTQIDRTMPRALLAAFVAAFACCSFAAAQNATSNISVIDIAEVFKAHSGFNDSLEVMKQDVEVFKADIRREQDRLNRLAEELKNYGVNSADYRQLEAQLTNDSARLTVFRNQRNREFLEREAQLYFDTYVEVSRIIDVVCEEMGVTLVLRVNNTPTDIGDRQSVLQTVNRNVVYQRPGRDITQAVIQRVNGGVRR